jgi:hypothetical protein
MLARRACDGKSSRIHERVRCSGRFELLHLFGSEPPALMTLEHGDVVRVGGLARHLA